MENEQRDTDSEYSDYSHQSHLQRILDTDSQTTLQDDPPTFDFNLGMENLSNMFTADDFAFLDEINEDDFEVPENLFGDELTDMGNFLNMLMPQHSVPQLNRVNITIPDAKNMGPGRKKQETISTCSFIGRKGILYSERQRVFYKTDLGEVQVGIAKRKITQTVRYSSKAVWDRANMYNEEVSNKGTGVGFSMFLHTSICLCIARSGRGVLEPDEGGDISVNQILIEVGGESYARKLTNCDWVISKYLLASASIPSVTESTYWKLSVAEDLSLVDSYWNSSIDNDPSVYTKVIREIALSTQNMLAHQRESLSGMWLHWFAKKINTSRNSYTRPEPRKLDTKIFWNFLENGSKNSRVPSPFKVLCPKSVDIHSILNAAQRSSVWVDVFNYTEGKSTYHVNSIKSDPTSLLWNKVPNTVDREFERSTIHEAKLQHFLRYSSFQYVYLMSELLPKISGKKGCYYSKYSRVGVSWGRHTRSSLTWFVCYYSFDPIMDESYIGKWEHVTDKIPYFRSPVFKVSRNDIHFASTLPYRFISMHAAVIPLVDVKQVYELESRLSVALMCWADSSWRTSVIAGTSRFTTCCHMSKSGDLQTLFEKGLVHGQNLRFPDYLYVRLIIKYIEEKEYVSYTMTPLFRLPVSLMSVEKDLPQGMNWHVRTANHDNDCMAKLIENHRMELDTREQRLLYLNMQNDFLKKGLDSGLSQSDFNELMDYDPGCVTLNVVFYIAMSQLSSRSHDKIAPMKGSQKIAIWPMMTDHHSMVFDNQVKTGRVRELLSKTLKKNKVTHGFFELLQKQLSGSRITTRYAMHMKDAKSADRDISIMDINCRPFQYFTESLVSLYNNSISEDMMTDSEKYTKVVNMCMKSLRRGKTVISSEDRSNFCGFMHPELMGLGVYVTGNDYGSTGLRAAGSILLTNTNREVIFPSGYTDYEALKGLDFDMVLRKEQKEMKKVPRLKVNIHMMQGIYANTGGLINTVCVTGLAESIKILTENQLLISSATTSDDVVRVVEYSRNFENKDVKMIGVDMPNDYLGICMMKENITKPIVSTNIAEFNNIVITRDGMVPQAPIHSSLIHQPLYGNTPMTDIITAVSNARSTLFWGDSPDLAESAMFGNIEMLKQKWLISTDQWEQLLMNKILPTKMSELISGFFPRSSQSLAAMWWAMEPEVRDQVSKGLMSVSSACHIFAGDVDPTTKKVPKITYIPDTLHRTKRLVNSIGIMRKVSSRLNPRYVQPIHFTKRRKAMDRTLELLFKENAEVPPDIVKLLQPPRIKIHVERHRKRDQLPARMGMSAIVSIPSLSNIRAAKFCKVRVGTPLTEEEQEILNLDDQSFEKKEGELERISKYQGISFKSPGGLPVTRMFDGRFFRVPMSFNFSVHLDAKPIISEQCFMYRGTIVHDFKTCKWGNDSLEEVGDIPIAFGTGIVNGVRVAFYQERGKETLAIEIDNDKRPQKVYTRQKTAIGVFAGNDQSPLGAHHFRRSDLPEFYLPGVTGDLTAIVNHGSYILSIQRGGFSIYRTLFKSRRCEIPIYCQKYMLPYPTYQEPIVKIKPGNTTILKGNFCCLNLEFDGLPSDAKTVTINLDGDEPEVVETRRRTRQWN